MPLSTKRLIILWATVLLITVFLGLQEWEDAILKEPYLYIAWYGFGNLKVPTSSPLLNFPRYQYQLIVVTLLIGFALLMAVERREHT